MRGRNVLAMTLALAMSACAGTPTVPFSDAEFAPYRGNGPASVEGQAFLRTEGGDVKTCVGESVLLAPGTEFDNSVVTKFGFGLDNALYLAGEAAPYWRKSMCDPQGKFTFKGVPTGTWFVVTQVRWRPSLQAIQGGTLMQKISLRPGQNNVMMSMDDLQTGLSQAFGPAFKKF